MSPTLKQVPLSEWRSDGAEVALCTLPIEPGALSARTGLLFSVESDDLGERYVAAATIDGDTVLFHARPKGAAPRQREFVSVTARGDVRNLSALLEQVLEIASVTQAQLLWTQPEQGPREWALYRLDDNNNRFLMSYFSDRYRAEVLAQHYESLGHKQTYYVERAL
ncbi:hypothetical protein [Azospira restricta]|uniref:hypothetical protein n=1 Tax=Azospira restricta TaxID=404405 RepID=UPI001EF02858|nr:hypothetical protein [Azospira restricta]